jgi:hypothetical protein
MAAAPRTEQRARSRQPRLKPRSPTALACACACESARLRAKSLVMISIAKLWVAVLTTCGIAACGGAQSEPVTPVGEGPPPSAESPGEPTQAETGAARPSVTAQECEAGGGAVVGDIGDGAIHKPDYKCASGAAPTGSIRAAEGGPVAVEGAVCCPK